MATVSGEEEGKRRGKEEREGGEGGRQWVGVGRGLQPLVSDRSWRVNSSQWLSL